MFVKVIIKGNETLLSLLGSAIIKRDGQYIISNGAITATVEATQELDEAISSLSLFNAEIVSYKFSNEDLEFKARAANGKIKQRTRKEFTSLQFTRRNYSYDTKVHDKLFDIMNKLRQPSVSDTFREVMAYGNKNMTDEFMASAGDKYKMYPPESREGKQIYVDLEEHESYKKKRARALKKDLVSHKYFFLMAYIDLYERDNE